MLVFVLDLDGTVVGNISHQILLHEICKITKKKFNLVEFRQKLAKVILRPHVIDFLKRSNSEFFIYSAGSRTWVEFIIKQIEIVAKMKFNRPLFTRDECLTDYKKCLTSILPKIDKVLKKKYNQTFTPLIIDNNDVYIDNSNLLLCSTYDGYFAENLPSIIDISLYKKYYKEINRLLKTYLNIDIDTNNYKHFQYIYYTKYIQLLKAKKSNDTFFYKLERNLRNITEFNKDTISKIRHF